MPIKRVNSNATMQKYIYNLDTIPAAHKPLFVKLNKQIEIAFIKFCKGNQSLTEYGNNAYIVVVRNAEGVSELIEIKKYTDDAPDGLRNWWIAVEHNNRWYGDPMPTLKRAKASIAI